MFADNGPLFADNGRFNVLKERKKAKRGCFLGFLGFLG
jgi:hypothetical protein